MEMLVLPMMALMGVRGGPAPGLPAPAADSLPWPHASALEGRVRALVAGRWGVDPGALEAEWGVVQSPWTPDRDTRLTLRGTGREGYWTVLFADARGERDAFALRVRVGVEVPRPVAARALERGRTLEAGDIRWTEQVRWGAPGEVPESTVEPGWVVRRRLRAGEFLVPPAVDRPVLVEGGAPVEILWRRGGISLSLQGQSLQSGMRGDEIWVRTPAGARLRGVVDGPGRVVIFKGEAAA